MATEWPFGVLRNADLKAKASLGQAQPRCTSTAPSSLNPLSSLSFCVCVCLRALLSLPPPICRCAVCEHRLLLCVAMPECDVDPCRSGMLRCYAWVLVVLAVSY